jgi:membrane-associated phospholipid phosphatase
MTGRLLAAAGLCALLFVALGIWVTHHPLSRLDLLGAAVRGTNDPLAIVLTNSGYGVALSVLGIGTIAAAMALRVSVKIPLAILISQIVSQAVVNLIKGLFARPRPEAWLFRQEPGLSYPSGHATTAIVFYGAWLVVLWNSPLPLPVRAGGVVVLAAWALGIGWSRVELGAHYPTDVIGGYLFGLGWLCVTLALAASRNVGLLTGRA